jgi:hypothetical protein
MRRKRQIRPCLSGLWADRPWFEEMGIIAAILDAHPVIAALAWQALARGGGKLLAWAEVPGPATGDSILAAGLRLAWRKAPRLSAPAVGCTATLALPTTKQVFLIPGI